VAKGKVIVSCLTDIKQKIKEMKQFKLTLTLGLVIIIGATSCNKSIQVNGPSVSQFFPITDFTKVNLANDANVTYLADSQFSVEVQAQQGILDRMNLTKNGTELKIDYKSGFTNLFHGPINVILKAPSFNGAKVSGSGDIKVPSFFKSTTLGLDVSGSGDILIEDMETNDVSADVTGSGGIDFIKGKTNTSSSMVSGSGFINMQEILSTSANATVTGSGRIKLNVTNFLKARITGSGDIFLKGNPTIDQTITGSGDIIKL
jgi:Putative auto-transporter adhesin, head GIN domain